MRPIVSFVSNFSKQYFLVFFGCLQVDRNYLKKVKPFVKVYADAVFHLWVKEWFYSFADYIETKHEEEYSLAKLQCYINNARTAGKVSKQLIQFTETYLKDFIADLASLCLRQYIDVYCGSVNENCFTESENAILKKNPCGPKANNKLNTSVDATITHTQERYNRLVKAALKNYSHTSIESGTVSEIGSKISKDINDYIATRLERQWERRCNYRVMEGKTHSFISRFDYFERSEIITPLIRTFRNNCRPQEKQRRTYHQVFFGEEKTF
jgi:hypothetical protein